MRYRYTERDISDHLRKLVDNILGDFPIESVKGEEVVFEDGRKEEALLVIFPSSEVEIRKETKLFGNKLITDKEICFVGYGEYEKHQVCFSEELFDKIYRLAKEFWRGNYEKK